MSAVDVYNTQTAVALLRQHIDYSHWYDKAKLTLKDIGGTQVMWTAVCLSQLFALNCLPSTDPQGHRRHSVHHGHEPVRRLLRGEPPPAEAHGHLRRGVP